MLARQLHRNFQNREESLAIGNLRTGNLATGETSHDDRGRPRAAADRLESEWPRESLRGFLRCSGSLMFFVMLAALYGAGARVASEVEICEQASQAVKQAIDQSIAYAAPAIP